MPRALRWSRVLSSCVCAVLAATAVTTAVAAPASAAPTLSWQLRDTGGTNHFRGLAAVDSRTAWVSGYEGQVLRTTDGGTTWQDVSPTGLGTEKLQFRDIEAFGAGRAVVMAAGPGGLSRLLLTEDGGATWTQRYRNSTAGAFFDCMAFSDAQHGLVMSDPVNGRFRILSTGDGGRSWTVLPNTGMPKAQPGEAGFAASGQCLAVSGDDAWFGSGGGAVARIYHSTDRGLTWSATASTLTSTASGGVFGLAFSTPSRGVVVGGDFADATRSTRTAATQLAGGAWRPSTTMPSGYRSGVSFVPGTAGTVLAVGLTGSDVSYDGGRTWATFDTGQFDTVECVAGGACWAAGDKGRVAVLRRS